MWELLGIALIIGLGIYYVTTLDFEIGSGFSEKKKQAKEGEYTSTPITPKLTEATRKDASVR